MLRAWRPMTGFKRGDVVLVLFPNSDLVTFKRRPALVVQADNLSTGLPQIIVLSLSLLLSFGSTGCRSFLAEHAMKTYPVKIKPVDGLAAPNRYQEDFL